MRYVQWLAGLAMLTAAVCVARAAPADGNILQLGFRTGHRCTLYIGGAVDCVSESPYLGSPLSDGDVFRPARMVAREATQLSVGGFASCAVVAGALDCWSALPAAGKAPAPPERLIAGGVTDVSVGDDHACAVAQGAALCWGVDFDGQVGHHDSEDDRLGTVQSRPWQVIASGVTQVAAGGDLSCAIVTGTLWCWGNTRLADDPRHGASPSDAPPLRVFPRGVSAVAAGSHHACAIVAGALWCWGDNTRGQVGIGYAADHAQHAPATPAYELRQRGTFPDGAQTCWWQALPTVQCRVEHPVKVIDRGVTAVYAAGEETCALVDGALWCWGYNWAGQLGIASGRRNVLKPTLAIARDVTFAAVTGQRTCAVMKDGALSCTLPCARQGDALNCPENPAFVAGNPNDMSGVEARVGVWRGTIGDAQVMVWFERPDTFSQSQYYYLRHRFGIELRASDRTGATWGEAPPGARTPDWSQPAAVWVLQAPVGDRMAGTWSAADGSRKAPITLTRVADAGTRRGASDGRAGLAFNAPRVSAQKLDTSQAADGARTTSALGGQVSITEIPVGLPHAAQVNAAMRAWFAASIADYYDCAFNNVGRKPDASYRQTRKIDLLAPPWLVMRDSSSAYCGGAYPSSGTNYTVWNLDAGKTVDPWRFIKLPRATADCDNALDCGQRLPAGLKAILVERFHRDNAAGSECADAIGNGSFVLHPEKTGLVFSTAFPHVIQACDEDIALPWKTLAPFLTTQGKAAMRDLQESH